MHKNHNLTCLKNLIDIKRRELNVLYEIGFINGGVTPSNEVLSKSHELDNLLNIFNRNM